MLRIIITKIKVECDDYNPELSHNGGSYCQPVIMLDTMSGIRIVIDDSSCGEFGDRYELSISVGSEEIAHCGCDGVSNSGCWSTFDRSNPVHEALYDALCRAGYGYYWLWRDQCDEEEW